jgi:two-component system sensor histidine kinase/response regulator
VKLTLLFIEDNENDYLLTLELLDQRTTSVVWCKSLAEGLAALRHQSVDVILLDLAIADSDGIETFDRLVGDLEIMPVVVVLTGSDDPDLADMALQRGAQDYLIKGEVDKELLTRSLRYSIERHKSETKLRETNEQLISSNRELLLARDEAVRANHLKSQFVANISHEIRTPMAGILGLAELLILETEGQVKVMAEHILTSGQNLMHIVNDILDLSKLEAGKMDIVEEVFQIKPVINDVVTAFKVAASNKKLKLECTLDKACLAVVRGDANRLRQVLLNLVQNAIKFTDKGSITINVTLDKRDVDAHSVRFLVRDTGLVDLVAPDSVLLSLSAWLSSWAVPSVPIVKRAEVLHSGLPCPFNLNLSRQASRLTITAEVKILSATHLNSCVTDSRRTINDRLRELTLRASSRSL